MNQHDFFVCRSTENDSKIYKQKLTVCENRKGVLEVDTVKGCSLGMAKYPSGGCYGECYACKIAAMYGIDFTKSISRKPFKSCFPDVFFSVKRHHSQWYRIGVAGDPCHDWQNTVNVCEMLKDTGKIPVIITKHWISLTDNQLARLANARAVINTSTSGLDTDAELQHRLEQRQRIKAAGMRSVCRVVTCNYGDTPQGKCYKDKQDLLLSLHPVIDNPLRISKQNKNVLSGDILTSRASHSIGGGKTVSLHSKNIYLGVCNNRPDQCGVEIKTMETAVMKKLKKLEQPPLFAQKVEFLYVKTVIGSGYEKQIAELAIKDGIAYRAARKNMQIHSAIVLKINDEVSGFFTFQKNEIVKEFCLLQSTIAPENFEFDLYEKMVRKVIDQNKEGWPMIITTDPKSKFETEELFTRLGFQTYLKMGQFAYMVHGRIEDVRMKLLAHITMTNVWNSIKGTWLQLKRDWNEKIEAAGAKNGVANPKYASREGCWQGTSGMSNIVLAKQRIEGGEIKTDSKKSLNSNASVLDPVACEVIVRFFMPAKGKRIYNPFGGGVQFGFVAGSYGYEYTSSEIRQNQCDANNKICANLNSAKWIKSDSSTFDPEGMFDLVFTCPPYYKVERYVDYDGNSPDGEINSLDTYEKFRDTLFAGYKKAISHLNDNCFFVVMTGDSRDKNGAYYCSESETEIFFKEQGLSVYNKIVYLECEFTRLAQAKKTLNMRKFPKREQKIIVAYKGDISKIKDLFAPVGRL